MVAGTCRRRRRRFVVDADAAAMIVIRTGTPSARTPAWTTPSRGACTWTDGTARQAPTTGIEEGRERERETW